MGYNAGKHRGLKAKAIKAGVWGKNDQAALLTRRTLMTHPGISVFFRDKHISQREVVTRLKAEYWQIKKSSLEALRRKLKGCSEEVSIQERACLFFTSPTPTKPSEQLISVIVKVYFRAPFSK